jgi:arsenate reductase
MRSGAVHFRQENGFVKSSRPIKVMFLCTGNACRSQMAEGFARAAGKGLLEPYSAGLMAAGVHPRTIAVMKEIGIDITAQRSKEIDEKQLRSMDMVITLCVNAEEACPWTPPDIERLHWPINDPVGTRGWGRTIMKEFRRTRDEIGKKVEEFVKGLKHDNV